MISSDYVRTMSRYNQWQNQNMVEAADTLSEADRQADRGAFFGSIAATCNHILWGDQIWMSRFTTTPAPNVDSIKRSVDATPDWSSYKTARAAFDLEIIKWAQAIGDAELLGDLHYYSGAAGRDITKPLSLLVVHFFNHQTHHRGQIHAMLTACGATTAPTDLPLVP